MNHIEKTITMTKKFYKAASILNTPEYVELMTILKEHPDYKMIIREIAKATDKKSYRNLNYENIAKFLSGFAKDEDEREKYLTELEVIKQMSKIQPSPYSYVKAWFFENYGEEYNKYDKKNENEEKVAA